MRKLLEKRNAIYGACAIWIMLFHTFRRIGMPYIPVLTNIVGIGNMAVDVFFFFSGLCLSLSAEKHDYQREGWREYYKRRLKRVLVPYLIICIPYYLWAAIFENRGGIVKKVVLFFANLSSASFWLRGTQTTWYVFAILLFYILFPVIYGFVKRNHEGKTFALLLGMGLFAVLSAYIPVLNNSVIVWARLPIFTIGVLTGTSPNRKEYPKANCMILSAVIVMLLGWVTSMSEISETLTIPSVYRLLLYLPMTLSLLYILSNTGEHPVKLLTWIGNISLEVYLIHITLLHPLKYYGIIKIVGYGLYLLLPVATLIIAWMISKLEKLILKNGV